MSGEDWKENKKFVLEKLEDHDSAQEKQAEINRQQSEWNHKTNTRIDQIADRLVKIGVAVSALTAIVAKNTDNLIELLKGLFK